MTNKSLILGAIAALLGGTAQAQTTITWDMSGGIGPPGMKVGTTHDFTDGGITITAAGFTTPNFTPTALFLKDARPGGDEVGLGIADPAGGDDNEITGNHAVVVNFSNAVAAGVTKMSFDFQMNSVTDGDSWRVFGSDAGLHGPFTDMIAHGQDENVHINLPLFDFYEFTAPTGDVLLRAVSGVKAPAAVPLPSTLPLFASGLALLGLAGWRKGRKSAAVVAA